MFAVPSKLTPLIFLAVSNCVAVPAFPLVDWLPAELTPGKSIFAVPSNDTPPMFLAVSNCVAVAALPPALPEMSPVICASTVNPANSADEPETTTFFHSAIILNFNYCFFFYLLKCCTPCTTVF